MNSNIPDELSLEVQNNQVRFKINDLSTDWMNEDDSFIKRIGKNNLNDEFPVKHLVKEIEIKNILDEGIRFLDLKKYSKAIEEFDRVLFYDSQYAEALLYKSYALYGQKHFVKSLRYYKRAVNADNSLKDLKYHKSLINNANRERDNFPKLKLNIYAGDEYFAKSDYENAIESYNRALVNPSKFKDKILSKLLNKKATALLRLKRYEDALMCFKKSLDVDNNDYAIFGEGFCEYKLNLKIDDKFKKRLDVSKKQMLTQACILKDLGYLDESSEICEFLAENHFYEDDFYLKLKSLL